MISSIETDIKYHNVVTYNNITSYTNNLMVAPGFVEKDILSLENPFEQKELITCTMRKQREMANNELHKNTII